MGSDTFTAGNLARSPTWLVWLPGSSLSSPRAVVSDMLDDGHRAGHNNSAAQGDRAPVRPLPRPPQARLIARSGVRYLHFRSSGPIWFGDILDGPGGARIFRGITDQDWRPHSSRQARCGSSNLSQPRRGRSQPVPRRDRVLLVTDVYRPDGRGLFPGLLERTPHDKSEPRRSERTAAVARPRSRAELAPSDGPWIKIRIVGAAPGPVERSA